MPDPRTAEARFAEIADVLVGRDGVTIGAAGRGFGSGALQVDGRIFAMLSDGRLVLKLSRERVAELVASRDGIAFDAGKGQPLKEWVALVQGVEPRWLSLAQEARAFVARHS